MRNLSIVIAFTLSSAGFSQPKPREFKYKIGDTFETRIDHLRPMQFSIGIRQVYSRMRKLKKLEQRGLLIEDKALNPAQVVIKRRDPTDDFGEGSQELAIIDRNHYSRALYEGNQTKLLVAVVDDLSSLSEAEFWKAVEHPKRNWVYKVDNEGTERSPLLLPKRIRFLKDDPYRTLAYFIRKVGGFENASYPPFREFHWANFFREHIDFNPKKEDHWRHAFFEGLVLSAGKKAKHLPGRKKWSDIPYHHDCEDQFEALLYDSRRPSWVRSEDL